ncbi:DUF4198 domain-containing protein [Natroniella sulfidigena]|uniref:DUF4198 domain-containing protein n=1 Tax=Natroniella sulfidigena TaxID=723921 RepID=UPI00200B5B5B|nr:DUF4198 domain-containing protein [Natroniella sulfidigena]MCK8817354.1 DUF4198 domain-containing protein [Natroniella sulfidigena]
MKFSGTELRRFAVVAFVALLVFSLTGGEALAHEIVLDFPQQVESGEEVEIEFFFGHHPDVADVEHSFFATLEDNAELMVINEEGELTELDFNLVEDSYKASFTPDGEGLYWVVAIGPRGVVDRSDRDPSGGMQLRYYDAKAPLLVGNVDQITAFETPLGVEFIGEIDSLTVGEEISLELDYDGELVSNQEVTIVGPNDRVEQVTTNDEGVLNFTFPEEGRWFIHVGNVTDLERQGEDYAEASTEIVEYDRVRYNSALYLEVEERLGFFQRLFRFFRRIFGW